MTEKHWNAYNYCVSFIDLLGQKKAFENEGLLPVFKSEEEQKNFYAVLKATIGPIIDLQESADTMMKAALGPKEQSCEGIPKEHHATYKQIKETRLVRQRWSDGLVFFTSLNDSVIKCPMNGVFNILTMAGSLCFLGLAKHKPLRGSVDISWAVELHENELYGAAIANAYKFESEVAQYPRIVVSDRTMGYLDAHINNNATDHYSKFNVTLAKICKSFLAVDHDGHFILHYLGEPFKNSVSQGQHELIYNAAFDFVRQEEERFRRLKDAKLLPRYTQLFAYFLKHAPTK